MPQPIEFTFADHRFRHTPLPAMPLVREYDKLRIRIDHESGALGTLAYTLDNDDLAEMAELTPTGVARIFQLVSRIVDGNKPGASAEDDADEDAPPLDELPRKLDELLRYYLRKGNVEYASTMTTMTGSEEIIWHTYQTEEQCNAHPAVLAPLVCTWHVLGGLFAPFADRLLVLFEKAKAGQSSDSTPPSEETDEATAPTSES